MEFILCYLIDLFVLCTCCGVFCYIQDGFSVNLEGCGAVESYRNVVPGEDFDEFSVPDVFALENGWEDQQGFQLVCAVHYH